MSSWKGNPTGRFFHWSRNATQNLPINRLQYIKKRAACNLSVPARLTFCDFSSIRFLYRGTLFTFHGLTAPDFFLPFDKTPILSNHLLQRWTLHVVPLSVRRHTRYRGLAVSTGQERAGLPAAPFGKTSAAEGSFCWPLQHCKVKKYNVRCLLIVICGRLWAEKLLKHNDYFIYNFQTLILRDVKKVLVWGR